MGRKQLHVKVTALTRSPTKTLKLVKPTVYVKFGDKELRMEAKCFPSIDPIHQDILNFVKPKALKFSVDKAIYTTPLQVTVKDIDPLGCERLVASNKDMSEQIYANETEGEWYSLALDEFVDEDADKSVISESVMFVKLGISIQDKAEPTGGMSEEQKSEDPGYQEMGEFVQDVSRASRAASRISATSAAYQTTEADLEEDEARVLGVEDYPNMLKFTGVKAVLQVEEADNLDTYFKVKYGKHEYGKSQVVENDPNPVFGWCYYLELNKTKKGKDSGEIKYADLEITVYQQKAGIWPIGDSVIGKTTISANELKVYVEESNKHNKIMRESFPLDPEHPNGSSGTVGTIYLNFEAIHISKDQLEKDFLKNGGYDSDVDSDGTCSSCESDAETEEDNEPEDEEERQKRQAEAREQAKQQKANLEAQMEQLEMAEIKEGRYEVKVHVIGVRGLKIQQTGGMLEDGLPNPVVRVKAWGQSKSTDIKAPSTETTFDSVLFFQLDDMNEDSLRLGQIDCDVYDANSYLSRGTLIGSWQTDFDFVYYQDHHEYYRKWVPLTSGDINSKDGISGFLQLSVTILGPGDKSKHHNREKEIEEEMKKKKENPDGFEVDIPQQKLKFLVATIHKAEHLPLMDDNAFAKGVDAYCRIHFGAGEPQNTKVKTVRVKSRDEPINPVFKEEIWMPFYHPTFSNQISISVWDQDGMAHERVASTEALRLDWLEKNPRAFEGRWISLYGSPVDALPPGCGSRAEAMNKSPDLASTYKGRLLISLRIDDNESKTIMKRGKKVKSRPKKNRAIHRDRAKLPDPKIDKAQYAFRMRILMATQIPTDVSHNEICIQMSCGPYKIRSSTKTVNNGVCYFDSEVQICPEVVFPADLGMVPDIMLHLIRNPGNNMPGFAEEAICFKRFEAKKLFEEKFNAKAHWIRFEEDTVLNQVGNGEHPGTAFIQLGFGLKADSDKIEWINDDTEQRDQYQARIHIYQARNLPAADESGLIDPYIKVYFGGKKDELKMKKESKNPLYYETIVLDDVELPQDRNLFPMFNIEVWDWDMTSGDDYIGSINIPANGDEELVDYHNQMGPSKFSSIFEGAKWYPLSRQKLGDTQGEVLVGLELIKIEDKTLAMPFIPNLIPESKEFMLQIIALGCRDLKGSWSGLQKPFVEFCINDEVKYSTDPSRNPSPDQPNFLPVSKEEIRIMLPKDPVFAPALEINVRDSIFGGLQKPLIGSTFVPLETRIKFNADGSRNPKYNPNSFSKEGGGNPFLDHEAAFSERMRTPRKNTAGSEASRNYLRSQAKATEEVAVFKAEKNPLTEVLSEQPEFKELDDAELKKMKPVYMIGRETMDCSWEEYVKKDTPFETFILYRGYADLDAKGPEMSGSRQVVGSFKGIIRLLSESEQRKKMADPPILKELRRPEAFQVRLYALTGRELTPKDDATNKSDPYLKISLGDKTFNEKENAHTATLSPDFFQRFDFVTRFPGVSQLHIEVYDKDTFFDELIGKTTIDLEDRWYNAKWRESGTFDMLTMKYKRSVETRSLWAPTSTNPQGHLTCWIDIVPQKDAATDRPLIIAPEPNSEFEMRVIVYKARNIPYGDPETSMSDMYITCDFGDLPQQSTDVHWRATDGAGSFNYRMKFQLRLPIKVEGGTMMRFAVWDKDLVAADNCLAEGTLDLAVPLKKAFLNHKNEEFQLFKTLEQIEELQQLELEERSTIGSMFGTLGFGESKADDVEAPADQTTPLLAGVRANHAANAEQMHSVRQKKDKKKQKKKKDKSRHTMWNRLKDQMGLGPDPDNTAWLPLKPTEENKDGKKLPEILVSVSIVPKNKVDALPAGQGREEPNSNPTLPEPTGRIDFTKMINPFYCLQAIIGSGNAAKLYMVCCVLISVALIVLMLPTFYDTYELIDIFPTDIALGVFGAIALCLCVACFKAQKDMVSFCGCEHPCSCCRDTSTTNEDNA